MLVVCNYFIYAMSCCCVCCCVFGCELYSMQREWLSLRLRTYIRCHHHLTPLSLRLTMCFTSFLHVSFQSSTCRVWPLTCSAVPRTAATSWWWWQPTQHNHSSGLFIPALCVCVCVRVRVEHVCACMCVCFRQQQAKSSFSAIEVTDNFCVCTYVHMDSIVLFLACMI